MASKGTTVFVSGRVFWAKIIGQPRTNYEGDAREWAYDFVPDDTSFLKEHKLLDRLKDPKDPIDGPFLRLKKPELDKDGNPNEPIRIYDEDNQAWDDRLLGNGTKVDVKLSIVDWGVGKKKSIYTTAIRVTDLVPYVSNGFGAMDAAKGEGNAAAPPPQARKPSNTRGGAGLDDLDDDVPF